MARASNDVSRIVCANTIQENDRRLCEARLKNQVLRHRGGPRVDIPVCISLFAEEPSVCTAASSCLCSIYTIPRRCSALIGIVAYMFLFGFFFLGKVPNSAGPEQTVWQAQPSRGNELPEVLGQESDVLQRERKYRFSY